MELSVGVISVLVSVCVLIAPFSCSSLACTGVHTRVESICLWLCFWTIKLYHQLRVVSCVPRCGNFLLVPGSTPESNWFVLGLSFKTTKYYYRYRSVFDSVEIWRNHGHRHMFDICKHQYQYQYWHFLETARNVQIWAHAPLCHFCGDNIFDINREALAKRLKSPLQSKNSDNSGSRTNFWLLSRVLCECLHVLLPWHGCLQQTTSTHTCSCRACAPSFSLSSLSLSPPSLSLLSLSPSPSLSLLPSLFLNHGLGCALSRLQCLQVERTHW